jgi:predicted aconitase with swiveling domain
MSFVIKGKGLTDGKGEGLALVSEETISFLGGIDPETGKIIQAKHPLKGESIAGKVFIFPHGRGSTAGCFIMYELANHNLAPAAIINIKAESIIATGAIIGKIPLMDTLEKNPLKIIKNGDYVKVDADNGVIEIMEEKKNDLQRLK